MPGHTSNINLAKPTYSEDADITVINDNMDIIDSKVGAVGNTSLQSQVSTLQQNITPYNHEVAVDCNELTSEGIWRTNANTVNKPDDKDGFIQVWKRTSGSTIYQRFYTADGYVHWRYTTNGSFENISWKIDGTITEKFGTNYGNTANPITNLNGLPINGVGYTILDASISPTGATQAFSFIKSGAVNASRYTVLVKRIGSSNTDQIYFGAVYDGTLLGWQKLAINVNIDVSSYSRDDKAGWDDAYSQLSNGYYGPAVIRFKNNNYFSCIVNKYSATYGSILGTINDNKEPYHYIAAGTDISYLDNLALNSNLSKLESADEPSSRAASLADLKTYISSIATGMKPNGALPITFTTNFTDDTFSTGARVYGTLMRRTDSYFSFVGTDMLGNAISLSNNGGTWTFNKLALNANFDGCKMKALNFGTNENPQITFSIFAVLIIGRPSETQGEVVLFGPSGAFVIAGSDTNISWALSNNNYTITLSNTNNSYRQGVFIYK